MGDQKRRVKKFLLMLGYFPFQLLWHILISPIIIVWISAIRSEEQAFEDAYMTKDNPMINQNGPTMTNKRKHWWITRFLGFDKIMEN